MVNKHDFTVSTIGDIVGVAVEYELHLEPNRFINLIDLYRTYLDHRKVDDRNTQSEPATFLQFVVNQSLLDKAALAVLFSTGDRINTPIALQLESSQQTLAQTQSQP